MKWPRIAYVTGYPPVPKWFTMLHHLSARRRCRKVGHVQTFWSSCNHCGLYLDEEPPAHNNLVS